MGDDGVGEMGLKKLNPPFLFNPREYMREIFHSLLCCPSRIKSKIINFKLCRVARMELAISEARSQLEGEFDIVQILRDQRFI